MRACVTEARAAFKLKGTIGIVLILLDGLLDGQLHFPGLVGIASVCIIKPFWPFTLLFSSKSAA